MSSVFNNKLKVYKSNITGEEKDYVVNNYLWVVLENEFGLTQSQFDDQLAKGESLTLAKFVTAVLVANGIDTTFEEVVKHTDSTQVTEFYDGFFKIAWPQAAQFLEEMRSEKETGKTEK